jgi:protocatechuate 3,4-dioxygenase beta subunit
MMPATRIVACLATGLVMAAAAVPSGQLQVEIDGAVWSPDGELIQELVQVVDGAIVSPDGQVIVVGAQPGAQRGGRGAPEGTALLAGRVVAADTGAPLREAEVTLEAAGRRLRRSTLTDANGQFTFNRLPDGEYTVHAGKAGHVRLAFGQRYAFGRGTPVTLAPGERLDTVNLALPRGSVLTVRVTDDRGDPVAGADVRIQQFEYQPDGGRRLTGVSNGGVGSGTTDDRGEFRAYGLMPGDYVVGATPRALPTRATDPTPGDGDLGDGVPLAPTFYPGTISVDRASPVSVGLGEETGIQISMLAARLGRVSGTVVDSRGQPAAGAQIQVVTRQDTTVLTSRNTTRVANDGTFSIGDLPPGEHWLTFRTTGRRGNIQVNPDDLRLQVERLQEVVERERAEGDGIRIAASLELAANGPREPEFASVPVVVSGDDVMGLYVATRPGTEVTGTITLPAGASLPRPVRVRAEVLGDTGSDATTGPLDEPAFRLSNVAGRVLFHAILPSGWAVASVTLDGRDITDEPIDVTGRDSLPGVVVTLTNDPTHVTGRVVDETTGQLLRDYVVVVQPVEALGSPVATSRRVRAVRPDGQGRFETTGLRPGRYLATAVTDLQDGRQYSPELRARLRASAREIVLGPGDDLTLDLLLTRGF